MLELKAQQRLTVTHAQFFNHDRGLKTNGVDIFRSTYDFGRTMSTIMRLAMLHCSRVPKEFWNELLSDPVIVNRFPGVVVNYGGPFQLTTNKDAALRYWSRIDCLYPHFYIMDKLPDVPNQGGGPLQNSIGASLYIIRNNFSEFIEINSNLTIRRHFQGGYSVSISVNVLRRVINNQQPDQSLFQLFKKLHRGERIPNIILQNNPANNANAAVVNVDDI